MNEVDGIHDPTPGPFELTLERHSVAVELRLAGELDVATCPRMLLEVDRLLGEECRLLTIDLDAVTFMDAAAIGALVHVHQQMIANNGALAVICDDGQPRRLLELTGMTGAFHLRSAQVRRPTVKAVPDPA